MFKDILGIISIMMAFDVICAIIWIASNQHPQGWFYFGTFTMHLLKFLFA